MNSLEQARKKVSFDVNELSYIIYDGPEELQKFQEMQNIVSNDPVLKFNPQHIQVSRKQLMELSAKKLVRYHELFEFTPYMKSKEPLFFNEQLPLSVHFSMFILTLRNLCSEKQKKLFLEPTYNGEIYGCYAQTELGHGSDVQSLETTATYDKATESFILHSPTPGSIKWWVGELGVFANHACVMAQLIINGKKHGVHAFVVRIRDDKTHKPLEGVEVGDIGPKYGFNAKDNGYLKFSNFKVPRESMLSKYSKVSRDGQYERRGNDKVTYATMLIIRAGIPRSTFFALSQAVTISVRYSLIRKQFKGENGQEVQIFDYQLQQEKIIPHIAQAYANYFGYKIIYQMTMEVIKEVQEKGDFSRLNSTHFLASGLKAIFTADCNKGLEIMRRAAGGHGFSAYSGIPGLQQEIAPAATYEGENSILLLQQARFLTKALASLKKGKNVPEVVSFMEQLSKAESLSITIESVKQFYCPEIIRRAMMNHSYYKTVAASERLLDGVANHGLTPKQSWDHHAGILLTEAGAAFTYFWVFQTFMLKVIEIKNENVKAVMNKLLCLYGVQKILENSAGYFEGKILDSNAFKYLFSAKENLLQALRPEAIGLVEAFSYDDNTLRSAIGRRDGKAYETLLDWAKNYNRVNKPEVTRELVELMKQNKGKIQIPKL